jgi:hypothetical protein
MLRRFVSSIYVLAVALGSGACNAVFGVEEGTLADAETATTATGGGGGGAAVTTTTAAQGTGGAGGEGAGGATTTTTGQGGGSGCGLYDGDAQVTVTASAGANVETFTWGASQSVYGVFIGATGLTEFNIAGGDQPELCNTGIYLFLAGPPIQGTTYGIVDRAAFDGGSFLDSTNAYLEFGGYGLTDMGQGPECDLAIDKMWRPFPGLGTVTVTLVDGVRVSLSLDAIVATGVDDGRHQGQGVITLDGDVDALCFQTAP